MWRRGLAWIKNVLFPVFCVTCGKEGEWWCQPCSAKEIKIETNLLSGPLTSITAMFAYHPNAPVGKLIKNFKYHYAHDMQTMWESVVALPESPRDTLVVPVPLYPKRARERGYNQAEILAQIITKKYKVPFSSDLFRIKNTAQQAKLEREERQKNMFTAFAWRGEKITGSVLLVDDVFTTGATMEACARVLVAHGAIEVRGFVLARD